MKKITIAEEDIDILISAEEIKQLIEKLAQQIYEDNKDKQELYFVTVLIGAKTFASGLISAVLKLKKFEIHNDFVKISSYGDSTISKGPVMEKDVETDIQGKDVIIVEDIVDTGKGLKFLKNHFLEKKNAKTIKICTLTSKPSRREVELKLDYLGKDVPDRFIFGYGIDIWENGRELPYIAAFKEKAVEKYKWMVFG